VTGVPLSSDGVMGLFCQGIAVGASSGVTGTILDKLYLLTSVDDLAVMGITDAYDKTNGLAVYQQVSEFYAEAGDGALLWLVVTATAYSTYVASSTFANLLKGSATADYANKIKMLGLCFGLTATLNNSTTAYLPAVCTDTITPLQTQLDALFLAGYQMSAIIDGANASQNAAYATIAAIETVATLAKPSVSVCLTGSRGNGVSGVGAALGRFAKISIGHGFNCVEDGSVYGTRSFMTNGFAKYSPDTITTGGVKLSTLSLTIPITTLVNAHNYVVVGDGAVYNGVTYYNGQTIAVTTANGLAYTLSSALNTVYLIEKSTDVQSLIDSEFNSLGDKQYMFHRTWPRHSGFFWNDAATCEDQIKMLSTQEYNRVANYLADACQYFFTNQIGKNLPMDLGTGAIDPGYIEAKQTEFKKTYIEPKAVNTGTGDLSGGSLVIDGTGFFSTKTMGFALTIVPTVIMGGATGEIKFSSTL